MYGGEWSRNRGGLWGRWPECGRGLRGGVGWGTGSLINAGAWRLRRESSVVAYDETVFAQGLKRRDPLHHHHPKCQCGLRMCLVYLYLFVSCVQLRLLVRRIFNGSLRGLRWWTRTRTRTRTHMYIRIHHITITIAQSLGCTIMWTHAALGSTCSVLMQRQECIWEESLLDIWIDVASMLSNGGFIYMWVIDGWHTLMERHCRLTSTI